MAQVIQLGKRRYLAGMRWSSYEKIPSKSELREDAARLSASWACVRVGEAAIQAGFCEPVDRLKRPAGLYSLAAIIADSRRQPWLGIFRIDDGRWWYIAVRDGHAILPDGDVIGGEEEIRAARDRHSGYTDWEYIDGDAATLLEHIDAQDMKPTPVRALYGSGLPVAPLAAGAALLCACLGGVVFWKHQQAVARQRALVMAQIKAQQEAPPSPLLTTPMPNAWLSACGQVILALPLSRSGWSLDQVACLAESVTVHWVRSSGATVAQRPQGSVSPPGDAVDQAIPLVLAKSGQEDAVPLAEAKLLLQAWAQAAGFALTITEPPPPLPGAQPAPSQPPPRPQTLISLESPISPFGLDVRSPGLRLTKLTSAGSGWRVEGILYGR